MDGGAVRVIADDLTGACDVAAALLPIPTGIVVAGAARWASTPAGPSAPWVVRNTQSRALGADEAASHVHEALADLPDEWRGVVLKKIDTGLRGPLGAELDAAMDAAGAELAIVLPAIPESGRTTVGGRQLVDGVPVDRTAFARDPDNPVTDARIGAVIERTSRRRTASVGIEAVRRAGVEAAVAEARAAGATIVVGDATTDDDLVAWVRGLALPPDAGRATCRLLVGSTGLARAFRRVALDLCGSAPTPALPGRPRGGGVLAVAGSAHPATAAQLAWAAERGGVRTATLDVARPERSAATVAGEIARGHHAALASPGSPEGRGGRAVAAAMAEAVAATLARAQPCALVLVGGETAFHVLRALDDPRLWIDRVAAPLAVRSIALDGVLAGIPIVTKGGSSGPPERLAELVAGAAA
jgi:uncharacterized protein YgbK (DUF1537 family)